MKPVRIKKEPRCPLETRLFAFVAALLSFCPFLFQNGGSFTIVGDFNARQILFTYAVSNALDGVHICTVQTEKKGRRAIPFDPVFDLRYALAFFAFS